MIWCALENPDLGQAFSYLNAIISPIEKFLEPLEAEEFPKNVEESQKFRESQLALKSKILCFLLISKRSFISTYRMIMFQLLHIYWGYVQNHNTQKEWLRAPSPHIRQDEGLTIQVYKWNQHLNMVILNL